MNPSSPSLTTDKPRIAFVSTRIAGTEGVSLEIEKWARVLDRMGVECYYIAGELDRPSERSVLIEEAHFNHPEVLDVSRRAFDTEVRTPDGYARGFRDAVGLSNEDLFVLQPTRVVARKGIEHAVELVRRLDHPNAKLVISHASGDEGDIYQQRIEEYAKLMDVELVFVDHWIAEQRGTGGDGQPLFILGDVFSQADLVTYPSEYEGFGNAFLEAIYYKKPVVCNRYLIYRTDIEPCGFDTIFFDGFLTNETVNAVNQLRDNPSRCRQMVEHNYAVANEFFSYEVLEAELRLMVQRPQNIYRLLKRGRPHWKQRFGSARNHNKSH